MAPMKAKQISKMSTAGKFTKAMNKKVVARKNKKDELEVEECEEEPVVLKRPAASGVVLKRPAAADAAPPSGKKSKQSEAAAEEEAVAARTQELKAMLVSDLKELVKSKGLDTGLKPDMVAAVLAFEAKERDAARALAAKAKEIENKIRQDIDS
eukprot:8967223-Karenia_brevis.AAC.1